MLFKPLNPMLLETAKDPDLKNPHLLYECKFDGWRLLVHKSGEKVQIYTKQGNICTDKFPEIQDAARKIHVKEFILDGEGCAFSSGRPVFDLMNNRGRLSDPKKIEAARIKSPCVFMPFDVLYVDGIDCTGESLINRKERLQQIIEPSETIYPVPYKIGDGEGLFEWTQKHNWEGVCIKDSRSIYRFSRHRSWQKAKHWKTIKTIVLGYRLNPFSLIVGLHFETVRFKAVAVVEHGFSKDEKIAFLEVAKQAHTKKDKEIQWITPFLACQIRYQDRTDNHKLRITVFEKFLPTVNPNKCVWSA